MFRGLAGKTGESRGTMVGDSRGKLKGLMEVHGRIVRGTRTGFEGSVGEFSHVGDILTCFNTSEQLESKDD